MAVQALLISLGPEIEETEEESFLLFSQSIPSQNLGFVDAKATVLDVSIGDRDLVIHQSPTILSSSRNGGTTGAVVWRITPLFANWITSPNNILFRHHILSSTSSVLELGCGVSGIVALSVGPLVQRYTLTDQQYIMKYLNKNLLENIQLKLSTGRQGRKTNVVPKKDTMDNTHQNGNSNIIAKPLDWETDDVASSLAGDGSNESFDAVIVCDCIYNDVLINPLVQTCVDACRLRRTQSKDTNAESTVCIIAQQLRSPDVFEEWLKAFHKVFRVWRVQDTELTSDLASNSGFVIHVGLLR